MMAGARAADRSTWGFVRVHIHKLGAGQSLDLGATGSYRLALISGRIEVRAPGAPVQLVIAGGGEPEMVELSGPGCAVHALSAVQLALYTADQERVGRP